MTMRSVVFKLVLLSFWGCLVANAEEDTRVSPGLGFQPTHSYSLSDIELIDNATGSLSLHIPISQLPPGPAGFTAGVTLVYNNKYWEMELLDANHNLAKSFSGGWRLTMMPMLDFEYHISSGQTDPCGYYATSELFQLRLTNPDGSRNLFLLSNPVRPMPAACAAGTYRLSQLKNENAPSVWHTEDGSYLRLEIDAPSVSGEWPDNSSWTVYRQDGSSIHYDVVSSKTQLRDRNGNQITLKKTVDSSNYEHYYEVMSDEFGRSIQLEHFGIARQEIRQPGHMGEVMVWGVDWAYPGDIIPTFYICNKGQFNTCPSPVPPMVVTKLSLPNSLSYTFGYTPTTSTASNYRELRTITMPTGAKIEYGYRLDSSADYMNWYLVLANTIASKNISINTEVVEKWGYNYQFVAATGSYDHSVHTAPDGGTTSYDFKAVSYEWNPRPGDGTITKIVSPDGSILDREWQYNYPYERPVAPLLANPWVRREWLTTASAGSPVATSIKVHAIDKNGNSTSEEERGWVVYSSSLPDPSSSALIRKTVNAYVNGATDSTNFTVEDSKAYSTRLSLPSTPRNLLASKEIQNSGGTVQSRSQFSYTETSPARNVGNMTAEYHWDSTKAGYSSISPGTLLNSSNSIVKTYGYTTRGNISSETDARGSATTYDYGNVTGCPPDGSTRTDLYRTGMHQGDGLLDWSYVYNCYSGSRTDETDPNTLLTNTIYDNFGRPTTITEGSYRKTVHTYNDELRWIVTQKDVEIFGDQRNVTVKHYDPLGRLRLSRQLEIAVSNPIEAATNEAAGIRTDTKYVYSTGRNETWVSNPYRIDESSAPTRGWNVKRLDKAGRICVDEWFAGAGDPAVAANCAASAGSTGATVHEFNAALNSTSEKITDAAGKIRQLYHDVLGRLIAVREDPVSAKYDTYYQYDLLDDLTGARQAGFCGSSDPVGSPCSGGQTRTFGFDTLRRLTWAMNPEMGGNTLSYEYDENGNVKNKRSTGIQGLSVGYVYDSLNRVKTREYSDGTTPAVTYCYDGKTWSGSFGFCSGSAAVPSKGHLTEVASTVSRTSYTYNSSGLITGSIQSTAGQSYNFGYSFSASSALATETYPGGRAITTAYDDAGRAKYMRGQSGTAAVNYAGRSDNLVQYTSHGAISSMTMGNGIIENRSYNSRLQATKIQAGILLTIGNCFQANDDAGCPSVITASGNNGNVQGQIIARGDKSWTQKYTYDGVNRLASASETGNWQQSYEYDAFGNRNLNTPTSFGLPISSLTPTSQSVFDHATNRLIGTNNYDSRGNLKLYGMFTLAYDGDDRISSAQSSAQSTRYEYDGEGHRVRGYSCSGSTICAPGTGTTTTTYVYDAFGKLAAEYGASSTSSGRSYFTQDHLGSTRLETDADGRPVKCSDYLPFGEEIGGDIGARPTCFSATGDKIKFTGKERDKETGLDYFLARYFSAAQGRFSSPDPTINGISMTDPQSWNLYSYVRNRPTRFVDLNGNWATEIHEQIVTFALKDYLSAGDLQSLIRQQYIMDKYHNEPEDQFMHAMSNGEANESADEASQKMWGFIAWNMKDANERIRPDGSFSDLSLVRLGNALHTIQDWTSPAHTKNGVLKPWYGKLHKSAIYHLFEENSPADDWAAIGRAVRLSMMIALCVNPVAMAQKGLTFATLNKEAEKQISRYVEWWSLSNPDKVSATQMEAYRQCAMGNPAACNQGE